MQRSDKVVLGAFVLMALFAGGMFAFAVGGFENGAGADPANSRVKVPELIGKRLSEAGCELRARGLLAQEVGVFPPPNAFTPVCPRQSTRINPDPKITSQIPQRGTRVVRGSVVLFETRPQ